MSTTSLKQVPVVAKPHSSTPAIPTSGKAAATAMALLTNSRYNVSPQIAAKGINPAHQAQSMNGEGEQSDKKVQAYAALEFANYTFYVRTLSVTIGRMPPMLILPDGNTVPAPSSSSQAYTNRLSPATQHANSTAMQALPTNPYCSPSLLPVSATRSTSPGVDGKENEDVLSQDDAVKRKSATPSDLPPSYSEAWQSSKALPAMPNGSVLDKHIHVDVDLGPIKAVSRDHARLFYHEQWNCWVLEVRGRNGVVVDGRWRAKGDMFALRHK